MSRSNYTIFVTDFSRDLRLIRLLLYFVRYRQYVTYSNEYAIKKSQITIYIYEINVDWMYLP